MAHVYESDKPVVDAHGAAARGQELQTLRPSQSGPAGRYSRDLDPHIYEGAV